MKTGIAWAVVALIMPVCVFATTLRLTTDIDLLVLDGKKVSSSLLRGADSIELDNGPHQVVFRGKDHSPRRQRTAGVHFASAGGQL